MNWLTVTILAYFILAIVFLMDKYILAGPIPNPKIYAFYSGTLGMAVLLLIPFVGLYLPSIFQIGLSFLAGIFFVLGLFFFYRALFAFEPSRVVPAVGALTALFTFFFVFLFSSGREVLGNSGIIAFLLLLSGSVLITYQKRKGVSLQSFKAAVLASIPLALYMVFTKYVYLGQDFWNGLILIRIGAFITALIFLFFFKEVREEILGKKKIIPKKPGLLVLDQSLGAGANLLLNWAIALAPLVYLSIINALIGAQYVFLFVLTIILSLKFPQFLKEEVSKEVLIQKIVAILLIGGGLAMLSLR